MDFSSNSYLKDYLRKKKMESEAKKANRNRIIEQQNRESWLKYQDFLRSQLAGDYEIPNEPIVVDDLLLYYDAGLQTSYSGTGASIVDITRNGRNGTIVGSPNWNSKGWFDFSNDYISTTDLSGVITAAAEDHSVEVWVYPTNNGIIVNYNALPNDPSNGYRFSAIELVSGQVEFGLWNGTGITSTNGTGALTLNAWHQIVLTYDKTTCRGYIDGELVGSVNVNFYSPMDSPEAFHMLFGVNCVTNQGNGTYFDGRMAIMKVYGRALTSAEVVQNYTSHHRRFVYNG